MGRLDGKVALISGAASGLGAAEAELFAREGAHVVVGDIQTEAGQSVVDRIAAQPTAAQGPFPGWVPKVPVVIERVTLLDPETTPRTATPDPATAATADPTADPTGQPTTEPATRPTPEPTRP